MVNSYHLKTILHTYTLNNKILHIELNSNYIRVAHVSTPLTQHTSSIGSYCTIELVVYVVEFTATVCTWKKHKSPS